MIDKFLPPVARDVAYSMGETLEAFAYSYLASYSGDPPNSTQLLSYKRAWGYDVIKFLGQNGAGTSGFLMAFYTGGNSVKVIVAIPGIDFVGQLFPAAASFAGVQVGSIPGLVYSAWKTIADDVQTRMFADPDFIALTRNKAVSITFCGFSQGAAAAEVLAAKYATANVNSYVKLFKFASPRVGNETWNSSRRVVIDIVSIYNDADPIDMLPWLVIDVGVLPSGYAGGRNMCYAGDPLKTMYNWLTLAQDGTTQGPNLAGAFNIIQYPSGNWKYHTKDAYRKLLARLVGQNPQLNYFRFNFLEHKNENNFQVRYLEELGNTVTPLEILTPAPAIAEVPNGMLPFRPADTTGSVGGGGDLEPPTSTPSAMPNVISPPVAPPGTPTWNSQPMAIRNRTRAR